MRRFVGWDIGGANLKASLLETGGGPARLRTAIVPFEIWREPGALAARLRELRGHPEAQCAITMTAELSDIFPDRAAGVRAVIDACAVALGGRAGASETARFRVIDIEGQLIDPREAAGDPTRVAAANWMATARLAAALLPAGVTIDVGSTTTDIVPFADGVPRPRGRTDLARLASGELVYTGLLRTPPAAIADQVPLGGAWCRVASEQFAISADVHRILGTIDEDDYTPPTPDGRGRDPEACAVRLARIVCADARDLGIDAIRGMARFLKDRQIEGIARALHQVLSGSAVPGTPEAVPCGVGASLAGAAAARCGLPAARLADRLGGVVENAGSFPGGTDSRGGGPHRTRIWDEAAPSAALAILMAVEAREIRLPQAVPVTIPDPPGRVSR